MKTLKSLLVWFPLCLSACTAQQMRKLEQSMGCQTAVMRADYETKSSCGFPHQLTSFVKSVRYGKEMTMPEGGPAPLLTIAMSSMIDGSTPALSENRIYLDLKGGKASDRRSLYCNTSNTKSLSDGQTLNYFCDFEDGYILKGEYVISELAIVSDRCSEPTIYKRDYETGGSEALCADYDAPAGYPLLRFTDSVRIAPIDQRKIESAWH